MKIPILCRASGCCNAWACYSRAENSIVHRRIPLIVTTVAVLLTHTTLAAQGVNKRALFVRRVLDLCLHPLRPKAIADMLDSTSGSPQQVMEGRTDYKLARSDLIDEGTIVTAGWISVSFEPSSSLDLTLQDLEPLLLDFPYQMTLQMAHFPDELRIRMIQHHFRVPAGVLILEVPPRFDEPHRAALERAHRNRVEVAGGEQIARDPLHSVTLTNDPTASFGFQKALTLRALRKSAQKQK